MGDGGVLGERLGQCTALGAQHKHTQQRWVARDWAAVGEGCEHTTLYTMCQQHSTNRGQLVAMTAKIAGHRAQRQPGKGGAVAQA